jgi:hypothetical protein
MSNRTYTSALNDGMGAANFPYIYDPNYVTTGSVGQPITGSWRPYGTSDISNNNISVSGLNLTVGAVAITGMPPVQISNFPTLNAVSGQVFITNTTPINVTGIILTQVTGAVSASFDSTAIVNAHITGNNYLANISGKLNSIVPVSGLVSLTNTAPIPISGVVNASVTIGNLAITGFNSTIPPLAVSGVFTASVGNVAVTGGNINAVNTVGNVLLSGISGLLAYNPNDAAYVTGNLNTSDLISHALLSGLSGVLDATQDTVTVVQSGLSIVSYTAPSGVAPFTAMNGITGMALTANSSRLTMFIQNIHTGLPLYVLLGTTTPGTGNFSMILNPSTIIGQGGDSFSDDHYRGQVNVSGGAWNAWQI